MRAPKSSVGLVEGFRVEGVIVIANLSQAEVGTSVVVYGVAPGADGRGQRLEDLGFLAGTEVGVERRAALGDPTIYELRGMRVALRKADAILVEVRSAPEPAQAGTV